jgi:hypothetical protein
MPKLYTPPMLYLPRYREMQAETGIRATIVGKYKVQVCRNGVVVREPFGDNWIPNLVLNQGLDLMITGTDCTGLMTFGRIGSGTTTPTVSDTSLANQLKVTSTILGSGNGTTNDTVNGAATHTKVYEFAAESATVTYNELGVGSAQSTNLGTRALFPSGVVCNNGDNMRLTYSLTFSIPSIVSPVTISLSAVNGFNVSGTLKTVGTFQNLFAALAAGGGSSGGGTWPSLFNGSAGVGILGSAPTTFPTVNTALSYTSLGSNVTGSQGSYTNGTFTRNCTFQWVPSNPSATVSNVNDILICWTGAPGNHGHLLLLNSPQTKANTNTLTITLSSSVARA